jgi:hypothetical protein
VLYNEIRSTTSTIEIECENVGGYLHANFEYNFKEGQSYEITIISDASILYRGKVYATDNENLQNYKLN